jgi:serine/threonine protein kinase
MAPELLSPKKFGNKSAQPTKPADVYAFGMVIYEVLTGFRPFYDKEWQMYEIMYHVLSGGRPTKPDDLEQVGLGDGTWKLVEECWIEEPKGRPTVEKVFTHLTRVAASSTIVGPTPDVPRKFPEFESSGMCLLFLTGNNSHLELEDTIKLPPRRTASLTDLTISTNQLPTVATVGTLSPTSTVSTSSDRTLVSSGSSEASRLDGGDF